jgi:hypothetical protein
MGNIAITINRANAHDARFLAALDSIMHGTETPRTGAAEWLARLHAREDSGEEVFVARLGGLYIGYLAVREGAEGQRDADALFVTPNYAHSPAASLLLEQAGIEQSPVPVLPPHAEIAVA